MVTPPNGELAVEDVGGGDGDGDGDGEALLVLTQLEPDRQYFLRVDLHVESDEEEVSETQRSNREKSLKMSQDCYQRQYIIFF